MRVSAQLPGGLGRLALEEVCKRLRGNHEPALVLSRTTKARGDELPAVARTHQVPGFVDEDELTVRRSSDIVFSIQSISVIRTA